MYKRRIVHMMLLVCILLGIVLRSVNSESVLVTIQTKSQEEMDALTAAIDEDAQNSGGAMRTTLGAIEATMSRVVDVDSDYLQTVPRSIPTLGLLNDIAYDSNQAVWTFTYQSMRIDPNDSINQFNRVLYMTKNGLGGIGDTSNACLDVDVTNTECLAALTSAYTVPMALQEGGDFLEFPGSLTDNEVVSSKTDTDNSLLQTITIQIPHERIRNYVNGNEPLARYEEIQHPIEGIRKHYIFGIGMLFYGSGKNQIVFDQFNLIENSREQLAIERHNSYSIARHVSFWTKQVKNDNSLRVAEIEYVLEAGHTLKNINASVNGQTMHVTDCGDMQTAIDAMGDSTCLTQYPLCQTQVITKEGGDSELYFTYVIPLPSSITSPFRISTLLTTTTTDGKDILSTLNFESGNEPNDVCADVVTQEFTPTDHVSTTLYRGHDLVPQVITGSFTIENSTAIGMPDSLMTLVLSPKDADAMAYFASFPDELINLDDLYMSHALSESELPLEISNTMTGVEGGRATVNIDPALLTACPNEADPLFEYNTAAQCVTTHDWGITGSIARPKSSSHLYFVHRVTNTDADRNWLAGNIFADNTDTAATFLQSTVDLVALDKRTIAQTYWIWPIYQWPDQSPIGLKDKTIVSFAWSIAKTGSHTSRRLLSTIAPPPPEIFVNTPKGGTKESLYNHSRRSLDRKKLLQPIVDYAKVKKMQQAYMAKIASVKRRVPSIFSYRTSQNIDSETV